MAQVYVTGEESIDRVLNRFKKLCEKEGLRREMKRRLAYEKPSERRRRQLMRRRRQMLRAQAKQQG
ncbi:MAG: 30S ribosomal protein S21 [Candidatus Poribacteria bacterium]|nr:30S ribosomal protein S21 [Candidatus Poribacteria bacterium]